MRKTNFALALLTAAALAACGGNGSKGGDQTLKTKFSSQVTFGDSLSDVGTYAVGSVVQMGGGKFTINGNNTSKEATLTGKNWTELMAAQFGLPAPCAAQTGLQGDATKGFSVAVVNHAGCFGYAQGGARVTIPVGPGNALTGSPLGQMTVPVVTQVANHLAAVGGKFKGDEAVFVMAGGNDVLSQLGALSAGATAAGKAAGAQAGATTFATTLTGLLAAGATDPVAAAKAIGAAILTESANPAHTDQSVVTAAVTAAAQQPGNAAVGSPAVYGPMVAKAQDAATAAGTAAGAKAGADYFAANAPKAVAAMATAGDERVALVKNQMVGKGANFVVVNNLPDVANTPSGKSQSASVQDLIKSMVSTFNGKLSAGLSGDAKIMLIDLFSVSHDQVVNPGPYGLTNTSTPACGPNPLGTTSLACNASNTIAGDVSHYMFADDIHPTPFEYSLVARYVAEQMILKGWL
jgi:phospholipase/lecithinase/hemolysin